MIQHQIAGKQAHDARLVAAMQVHGVASILTFNTGDFTRYTGTTVVDPAQVQTGAKPALTSSESVP